MYPAKTDSDWLRGTLLALRQMVGHSRETYADECQGQLRWAADRCASLTRYGGETLLDTRG
jgi:hypothetical protein